MSRPLNFHTCSIGGLRHVLCGEKVAVSQIHGPPRCGINRFAGVSNGYCRARASAPTSELYRDTRTRAVRLSFPRVHANWVLLCSAEHETDLFRITSVLDHRRCIWLESGVRLSSPIALAPTAPLTEYSATPMLSDSPAPGKQFDSASSRQVGWARRLPQWAPVLESVFRRIRGWRVPPRWSVRDWSEELKALSLAAAWLALGDFDPTYGVPLDVFLRERILASALTRYRQEWTYSVRCTEEVQNGAMYCSPCCDRPAYGSFGEAVARLAATDQWLIEQIFWHGKSEAEVSKHLGISQQAVNKRKKSALRALRRNFE